MPRRSRRASSSGERILDQRPHAWRPIQSLIPQGRGRDLRPDGSPPLLGSGMIRGIGPVYATKLVRAFGEAVFEIIEQKPHRLREVTGIGPKRAERIIAGWAEQKVIREIMLFLEIFLDPLDPSRRPRSCSRKALSSRCV